MRRARLFATTALLLGGSVTASALRTSGPAVRGDVNADGEITAVDALAVLSHVVGKALPDGYTILPNGDANGDGEITAADALVVLSYTVGADVSEFPIGEALPSTVPVASVTVEPDSSDLMVGSTLRLEATPRDSGNAALTGRTVTWTTSDTALATVSGEGLVTAVRVGDVTITATVDGTAGTARIRVVPATGTMSIDVSPRQSTVLVDGTVQLSAQVRDGVGNPVAGRVITWTSLDPAVATVSDSGLVTGVALGTTEIQASSDTLTANVTISVVAAAAQANRVWVGAVSTDWSDPANWDPAGVPIATDTLLIRAGGAPLFGGSNGMIAGLVMEPGATLDIGGNELQVSGRLDVDGAVQGTSTGKITVQGVEGKESYVRGKLPGLTINGTTVIVGPTEVDGTLEVNPASILELNGQSVHVSRDLTIRGGLRMRERTELLDVRGTAYFFNDASTTDAVLEGGTLHVGGDFTVDVATPTSANPFPSTGEHLLVLDGTADQTVRNVGLEILTIQALEVPNPSGRITFTASPIDRFRVQDDFDVLAAATITGNGRVNVHGDFTSAPGSAVSLVNLAVRGTLSAGSGFQPDTLTLLGRDQLIPAGAAYLYQNVVAAGAARFAGTTDIAGSLILGCLTELSDCGLSPEGEELDLAGQSVTVGHDLRQTTLSPSARLYMNDPAGDLTVGGGVLGPVGLTTGPVEFTVATGDWTAGTLRVAGDFFARDGSASGSHTTILNGAGTQELRIVEFGFQELQLAGAGDVLMNDTTLILGRKRTVTVHGNLGIPEAVRLHGTGRMDVFGNVETVPGSSIEIGALSLGGVLRASGTLMPDTAEFFNSGTAQTIQNNPDYRNVVVRGRAVFGGSMTFSGSLIVHPDAELTVGARHVTISKDMKISGILRMQDARDTLTVLGDSAVFYAGTDPNVKAYATEGVLRVAGHLVSDSTGFYPTRNHKVIFTGGDQKRARGVFNHFEVAATGGHSLGVTLKGLTVRGDLNATASKGRITLDSVFVAGDADLSHPDTVYALRASRIEGDLTMRHLRGFAVGGLRVGGDLRLVDGARLNGWVHHYGHYIEEGDVVDPEFGRPMLEGLYYLRWVQQPSNVQVGEPFDPPVSVELVDSAGNRLTRGSTMITLNDNGFLSGTVRLSTVDGVATFPGIAPTMPNESARLGARTITPDGATPTYSSNDFVASPAPPAAVTGGLAFSSLTAGVLYSCGLTDAGAAYCWGLGSGGRLGTGDESDRAAPTAVAGGLAFTQISAGSAHTCALTDAGAAYCWGYNQYGNLGTGTVGDTVTSPAPVAGGHTFSTIAAGYSHTCALTADGKAYCWGNGSSGILGNGQFSNQSAPVAVSGDLTFTALSTDGNSTCGLTAAGEAYCWGLNGSGQLGDGTTTSRATPTLVSGGYTFASIAAGVEHTCALDTDGQAFCWGHNQDGRLGDGSFVRRLVPTAVSDGIVFASIDVERYHSCGVTAEGEGFCWGRNAYGELGDGNVNSSGVSRPVPVALAVPLVSIRTGNDHTLGLTATGAAYAWGANSRGQLGTLSGCGAGAAPGSGPPSPRRAPQSSIRTHPQPSATSSARRIRSIRSIRSSSSFIFAVASARQRGGGGTSSPNPWNSVRTSASVNPACCAKRITARRRSTSGSYRRRPFTRAGTGRTPASS